MAPPGQYRVSPGVYRPMPQNQAPQSQPMPRMHTLPYQMNQAPNQMAQGIGSLQGRPQQGTGWNQPGVGTQGNNMAANNFGFDSPMGGAMRPQYNAGSQVQGANDNFGFGGPNGGAMRPYYNDASQVQGAGENFGFGGPNGGAMRPQYIDGPGYQDPKRGPMNPEQMQQLQQMAENAAQYGGGGGAGGGMPQAQPMNPNQMPSGGEYYNPQPPRPQNGPMGRPRPPSRPVNGPEGRPAPGLMGKPPVNNHSTATQKRIPNAVKLAAQGRY